MEAKRTINYKSLIGETADVDTASRTIVAYFSKFGNKDLDGDIILPGAFTKTIAERGPKGRNEIFHLFNHRSDLSNVLGKPKELVEDAYGLKATTTFINTKEADAVLEGYASGVYNQHSIGYSVIKWQRNEIEQAMELTELKLYEGSTVLWGANPETPFLGFAKNLGGATAEQLNTYIEKMWADYEELYRLEQKGVLAAEFKGIARLQRAKLRSITTELATLKAVNGTQPPDGTVPPNPLKDFKASEYLKLMFYAQIELSRQC